MAGDFAKGGAVQDKIGATVEDAIKCARSETPGGESLQECGAGIPDARRKAVTGVKLFVTCQAERDKHQKAMNDYILRGSKNSQQHSAPAASGSSLNS